MKISDLNSRHDLQFVSDSQDVEAIKNYVGIKPTDAINTYDSFFVKIQDGEYVELYGMVGIIPYLDKEVVKIF